METANILVCEDERLVARDIESVLERSGYRIVGSATNGEEALRMARDNPPDLALLDIRLKGSMSGIEVAETLAEEFGIPSIYLTAYADDETLELAKATQPLSYLLKPFDESELKAAVEVGLHRHRKQRQLVSALQTYIDEHFPPAMVDRAVQVEREFMTTERINSQLQVAGNIADRMSDQVDLLVQGLHEVADDSSLSESSRNALRGALSHQARIFKILDQLWKCSRAGRPNLDDVMVETLVTSAMHETSRLLGKKLNFIECFASESVLIRVDKVRMQEALIEIFMNAYQAMPEDTLIIVSTARMYEEFPERFNPIAQPGNFVQIKSSDFGRGMAPDEITRAFEPCFSASGVPLSTGLGLCVAYAAVQQHGGWMGIESTPTAGTQVSVYLPVEKPKK